MKKRILNNFNSNVKLNLFVKQVKKNPESYIQGASKVRSIQTDGNKKKQNQKANKQKSVSMP